MFNNKNNLKKIELRRVFYAHCPQEKNGKWRNWKKHCKRFSFHTSPNKFQNASYTVSFQRSMKSVSEKCCFGMGGQFILFSVDERL